VRGHTVRAQRCHGRVYAFVTGSMSCVTPLLSGGVVLSRRTSMTGGLDTILGSVIVPSVLAPRDAGLNGQSPRLIFFHGGTPAGTRFITSEERRAHAFRDVAATSRSAEA